MKQFRKMILIASLAVPLVVSRAALAEESAFSSWMKEASAKYEEVKKDVLNWWNDAPTKSSNSEVPKPATNSALPTYTTPPTVPLVLAPEIYHQKLAETSSLGSIGQSAGQSAVQSNSIAGQGSVKAATRLPAKQVELAEKVSQFKSQSPFKVEKVGQRGDPNLKRNIAGVPVFELEKPAPSQKNNENRKKLLKVKVDKIPALDIGEESVLKSEDFEVPGVDFVKLDSNQFAKLQSPDVMNEKDEKKWITTGLEKTKAAVEVKVDFLEGIDVATLEKVSAVSYNLALEQAMNLMPVDIFTVDDYKELGAEILFRKKEHCHLASGLFSDLSQSKVTAQQTLANLKLGLCLHEMGLFSESVHRLTAVISSGDKEHIPTAVAMVVRDLPQEFEGAVANALSTVKDMTLIPKESQDAYHYILAKAAIRKNEFKRAEDLAEKVSTSSTHFIKAQYLLSIAEYGLGKGAQSITRMKDILKKMEDKGGDSTLMALVALNLGRTSYMEKKYDESSQYFLKIRKDNPLWIQALTEQAWSQLQNKDNSGAIGNMYSIHSPFFKEVYKPESYVVRTIGYLNYCQFGDAYRTLSQLETMYRPWFDQLGAYQKENKESVNYYNTVVKYLKAPKSATVDGLPGQVIREMARQKDFLNVQEAINNKVDELEQYTYLNGLIEKDKTKVKWKMGKAQDRINDFESKIVKSKVKTDDQKFVSEWKSSIVFEKDLIEFYKFQLKLYEESRTGLLKFKEVAKNRLNRNKEDLKVAAGKVLQKRLERMTADLSGILDNNEFLRYEVFAGSGENIRVQVAASGESQKTADKRVPASMKPKSKDLQWEFDGEYWEDEIGNYRSSLKDNCGKTEVSMAK